jgi:glycosyltransferase involved in cell wall biosynthesis
MPAPADTIIIVPTYNEVDNIGAILDQIYAVSSAFTVLVVDDSSPDGTAAIVKAKQPAHPTLRLLERTRDRGFGKSYLAAMQQVLAEHAKSVIVTMDADFSHEPAELPALLAKLDAGADVVIGSRHARGGRFPGIPLWRRVLSRAANTYVRLALALPVADATSGFIAMRADALRRVALGEIRSDGYGFTFDLKYRLYRAGCRMTEHPVAWPNRHLGHSKMSNRIMWESFLLPWRIRAAMRRSGSAAAAR